LRTPVGLRSLAARTADRALCALGCIVLRVAALCSIPWPEGGEVWQHPGALTAPAGSFLKSGVTADLGGLFEHVILTPLQFY